MCQHNQWNVRSLASFLIVDCWRSCQSTAYVHDQTRVLKVPVLQLLFWVCYSHVVNFIITTANTVTATITELSSELYTISSVSLSVRTFSAIAMPPVSFLSQQLTKCPDRKHAGRIPAITERMLIATPNERLNNSLPIYRRNWHMISVLTSSQQQKWSPCSAPVNNVENISNYRTQCSIYEWFILQQQKKPKILGYKDTLFRL